MKPPSLFTSDQIAVFGLALDIVGALLLVAHGYPKWVRNTLFRLFPTARRLETARSILYEDWEITREDHEKEIEAVYRCIKNQYPIERLAEDNPSTPDNPKIHEISISVHGLSFTFQNHGGMGTQYGTGDPHTLADRIVDRGLERYFVKVGVIFLAIGFLIQILARF